ncbi:LacI family DNA-binding transcriptional regulator [Nocardiopsis protaetiae]|uniref:LacI family DNA-binding transcriptional regulator n=1 Tax=Nocardiopsis protaetiae TaxID=3382270 RepID=UPI00387B65F6
MTDQRPPTLDSVAARAGVSRSVASRALNGAPHVSRDKREAVRRAVRELGYVPDPRARALATRRNGTAALVIAGEAPAIFADPFFSRVIVGLSAALEEGDLHLMLCLAASERGRNKVKELLRSRGTDGVMPMAVREGDPLLRVFEEIEVPVVFGGRPAGPAPRWYVDVDNVGGGRQATEHLIVRGRRRIAMVSGPADTEVARARERGHREALTLAGRESHAPERGDFTEAGGAAAMSRLLERLPDVDGVFAANDNMAAGALRVLRAAGRDVPGEVSLVGFDDLDAARTCDPPLTTVRQPVRALGRETARMLLTLIGGGEATPLILPTELVVRSTS